MGAGPSKQAGKAGKAATAASRRQYPSTSSIPKSASPPPNLPSQTTRNTEPSPDPQSTLPAGSKNPHIDLDGRDPHFGSALRRLGPAISVAKAAPHDTAFPTSSQPPLGQQGKNIFPSKNPSRNPSLMIVQARDRITQQYEQEMESLGRSSFAGRTLLSAKDLKEILRMRDQAAMSSHDIEKQMRLKPGILIHLAKPGVYANV